MSSVNSRPPEADDPDAEIIRQCQRQQKRRKLWMAIWMAIVVPMEIVVVALLYRWLDAQPWRALAVFLGTALVMGAGIVVIARLTPMPKGASSSRVLRRRTDEIQRSFTRFYAILPLVLVPWGATMFGTTMQFYSGKASPMELIAAGALGVGAFLYLCALMGWFTNRKADFVLQDELFRSWRQQGVRNALWVVLVLACLDFALGLARPRWAVAAVPEILFAAIATIAGTIAFVSWRAGRDA